MNKLQVIPSEWLEEAIRWDGTNYRSGDGTDLGSDTKAVEALLREHKWVRFESFDGTIAYLLPDKVSELIKANNDEITAIHTYIGTLDRDIQRIEFINARLMSALNP